MSSDQKLDSSWHESQSTLTRDAANMWTLSPAANFAPENLGPQPTPRPASECDTGPNIPKKIESASIDTTRLGGSLKFRGRQLKTNQGKCSMSHWASVSCLRKSSRCPNSQTVNSRPLSCCPGSLAFHIVLQPRTRLVRPAFVTKLKVLSWELAWKVALSSCYVILRRAGAGFHLAVACRS